MTIDAEIILDAKTLLNIKYEVKNEVSGMSKGQIEQFINEMIDKVLADPGNPVLKAKATYAAEIWNSRYTKNE